MASVAAEVGTATGERRPAPVSNERGDTAAQDGVADGVAVVGPEEARSAGSTRARSDGRSRSEVVDVAALDDDEGFLSFLLTCIVLSLSFLALPYSLSAHPRRHKLLRVYLARSARELRTCRMDETRRELGLASVSFLPLPALDGASLTIGCSRLLTGLSAGSDEELISIIPRLR
jgi:hypothetical protein